MKKVTSRDSLVLINHFRNLLAAEGIDTLIKNEHMVSVMGEVPFQEVWPELWVVKDMDYDRAKQLIDAETVAAESPGRDWRCKNCGEQNEAQFGACWNCGRSASDGWPN